MPESLASLKRKFYTSLDQLTHSTQRTSSTSADPTSTNNTTNGTASLTASERLSALQAELKLPREERAAKRLRVAPRERGLIGDRFARHGLSTNGSTASEREEARDRAHRSEDRNGAGNGEESRVTKVPSSLHSKRNSGSGQNGQSATVGTEAEDEEEPRFAPESQEAFLARLRSYNSVSLWHPKPSAINEVAWAKQGWWCVGVNTVQCLRNCEARVDVSLATSEKDADGGADEDEEGEGQSYADKAREAEEAMEKEDMAVAALQRQIVEGHEGDCPWRRHGCQDDVYRLRLTQAEVWQGELGQRHSALMELGEVLMDFDIKTTEKVQRREFTTREDVSTEKLFAALPSPAIPAPRNTSSNGNEEATTSDDSAHCAKAMKIALHGWTATTSSSNALLSCPACFQRIGLWMYTKPTKTAPASTEPGISEPADDSPPAIDLTGLHRDYCPYVSATTQNEPGAYRNQSGIEILHRVVEAYTLQKRRRKEREEAEMRRSLRRSADFDRLDGGEDEADEDNEDDGIERDEDGFAIPRLLTPEQKAARNRKDEELMGRMKRIKRMFSMTRKGRDKHSEKGKVGSGFGILEESRRGSLAGSGVGASSRTGSLPHTPTRGGA